MGDFNIEDYKRKNTPSSTPPEKLNLADFLKPEEPNADFLAEETFSNSTLEGNFNPEDLVNNFKTEAFRAVGEFKKKDQGKYTEERLNEHLTQLYSNFDKALEQYREDIKNRGNKSVEGVDSNVPRSELETALAILSFEFQKFLDDYCQNPTS